MHVAEKKSEDMEGRALLANSQENSVIITSRENVRFAAVIFDMGLDSSDASMAEEEDDFSIPDTPEAIVKKVKISRS